MNPDSKKRGNFQIIALTPPGLADPAIAVAAGRAGYLGILDLEFAPDIETALDAMQTMAKHAGRNCGIKLQLDDEQVLQRIAAGMPDNVGVVVLTAPTVKILNACVQTFHAQNRSVVLEVTSLDQAREGARAKVDALIAKGCEAGGFIGEKSAFVLMQQIIKNIAAPVWIQGGIGLHTAAACYSAGAQGVVLDFQLALLRESSLPEKAKRVIARMDGAETVCIGENNSLCRIYKRPGVLPHAPEMTAVSGRDEAAMRSAIRARISWDDSHEAYWPIGQDAAFAAGLAKKYRSVGSLCKAIAGGIGDHIRTARKTAVLREGSPLAQSHGTIYPIVQGPMARVSDNAAFLAKVADAGALPFAALSQMRPKEISSLLTEVSGLLGVHPWGVGLLGFIDSEQFNAQLKAIEPFSPKFAIIAGGLPNQVALLESKGTLTYVHIPSPSLLDMFVDSGARRFIFEGNECGGHIGPRPGFVLWEGVIEKLLGLFKAGAKPEEFHLLFAGGIHDALSSAAIATMTAPLAVLGAKIGIQMGTAYLLTEEITASGAILSGYQKNALDCSETVVLELSPGHVLRCCDTPFVEVFTKRKKELVDGKRSHDELRRSLEKLVEGRPRIGSRGLIRNPAYGSGNGEPYLVPVDAGKQQSEGLFLIGQLAALRNKVFTMRELHRATSHDAGERLRALDEPATKPLSRDRKSTDIAIIGMACFFPKAKSLREYWDNVIDKTSVITEVPSHRWDWRLYYDENRQAKDKIYSKWGGFMDDLLFDPTHFGMPPKSIASIDPMQLMALEIARRTLFDAGYEDREFDRGMASVIIGASGGAGDVGVQYGLRSELPRFLGCLPDQVAERLPEWTEDTFAGILQNVVSGRIANRLNLGGVNYTTDAACASSLAAIYQAVGELTSGRSNLVIAGGVDTVQGPFSFMCFSKTQALSPRGRCSTFDVSADGIVISEGIAMLALKRLEDAEQDGDRIYAVIKGVGGSSDGKAKGLTAPLPAGQLSAMRRAYEQAGFGPDTIGLFEAHGTGTPAGDTAELESTTALLQEAGGRPHQAAIGSVKTLLGHTKATAGVAGLIKTTLALYHRILPPHAGVEQPNPVFQQPGSPLYLTADALPWLGAKDRPRRAGVSAFGFGGTNFHVVLEEYVAQHAPWNRKTAPLRWPAELFLWHGADRAELITRLSSAQQELDKGPGAELRDIAYRLAREYRIGGETLAIIAADSDELGNKMSSAASYLTGKTEVKPSGVYVGAGGGQAGKVALLFPGQGSQYTDMFRELALNFPIFADTLSEADEILSGQFENRFGSGARLSHFIFPRGCFSQEARTEATRALTSTDVAQPALGAVAAGLWRLMESFGLEPSLAAGHSHGEFTALFAGKVIDFATLLTLSEARGRFIVDAVKNAGAEFGTMVAVNASREYVKKAIAGIDGLIVANHNAPRQCILSGSKAGIEQASARISEDGVLVTPIPVSAAFHSDFVQPARAPLAEMILSTLWRKAAIPVYSNTTGDRHADDTAVIKQVMVDHLVRPVEFVTEVDAMYRDGARVFLELGPKAVVSKLVSSTLEGRPHKTVAIDTHGGGTTGLLHAFGQLLCAGVPLNAARLFEGRGCSEAGSANASRAEVSAQSLKHSWLVNGSRSRRATEPVKQIGVRFEELSNGPQNMSETAMPASPVPGSSMAEQNSLGNGKVVPRINPKEGPRMRGIKQAPDAGDSVVLTEYFDMMRHFLETQERIMGMYMGGGADYRHTARIPSRHISVPRMNEEVDALNKEPIKKAAPPVQPVPAGRRVHAETEERVAAAAPVVKAPPAAADNGGKSAARAERPNGRMDRATMTSLMLRIIEDKTGYPPDMIGLSQNLEADLGIDSIKRVEIIGALIKELPSAYGQALGKDLSKLNSQPTLNSMLDLLQELNVEGGVAVPFDHAEVRSAAVTSHSFRHIVAPEQEPIDELSQRRLGKGHFIITRDNRGVAETLAHMLIARQCTVSILDREILKDEHSLQEWCASPASKKVDVAGIVHLAQLGSGRLSQDSPIEAWRSQLQLQEKSLFILLRELWNQLKDDGHVLSASSLGGLFARDCKKSPDLTLQGGAVGLLKSLYEERRTLRVKAVDTDPGQGPESIARCLLDELELVGGRQEVGYPEGNRTIFRTVAESLDKKDERLDAIRDMVVLATGGLRGVTAELLRKLALPGNILVLTGRSPLPSDEPEELKSLATTSDLRNHFISEVRKGKLRLTPAEIRRKVQSILGAREMRNNLADFRKRGAKVEYYSVDVTNDAAMHTLLDSIYAEYKGINAVVHGAGVIEDKLLADKTNESWSRVVETKVLGLLLLQKYLRPESLRFFTVMSSVAGRYGNSGQTDYATANELMNRLCSQLSSHWGSKVRVKAFCWGPWGRLTFGPGMVTEETEAKFAKRSIFLVSHEGGSRLFKDELTHDGSHHIEVVCGEGPWEQIEAEVGRTTKNTETVPSYKDVARKDPATRESPTQVIGR